jgi:hypothetical protein
MAHLISVLPVIAKIVPRLATEHDGEVLNSVRAIARYLKGAGADFHDLALIIGAAGPGTRDASSVRPPAWFSLPIAGKLAWLSAAAFDAGQGSWTERFARDISRRIVACLPLSPKQTATAQRVIAEAWAKGCRP